MFEQHIKEILSTKPANYLEAKTQAAQIDQLLGFRCEEIEVQLRQKADADSKKFWIGLDSQAFQTPYSEILEMIEQINPQPDNMWIDLGAAYGRVGIVLSLFSPHTKFLGYEIVAERVEEAKRIYKKLNLPTDTLRMENLVDKLTTIPVADVYFIYDFSDRQSVLSVLSKLKENAKKKPIKVIARGRGAKNWIFTECPWLCEVNPPQQFSNWILFQS